MTTNISKVATIDLTNEEITTLENALEIISNILFYATKENMTEIWYNTYDGNEMMSVNSLNETISTIDNIMYIREIM